MTARVRHRRDQWPGRLLHGTWPSGRRRCPHLRRRSEPACPRPPSAASQATGFVDALAGAPTSWAILRRGDCLGSPFQLTTHSLQGPAPIHARGHQCTPSVSVLHPLAPPSASAPRRRKLTRGCAMVCVRQATAMLWEQWATPSSTRTPPAPAGAPAAAAATASSTGRSAVPCAAPSSPPPPAAAAGSLGAGQAATQSTPQSQGGGPCRKAAPPARLRSLSI